MNKTVIINELVSRGYKVEEREVIKNGIVKQAIVIKTDTLSPSIYLDTFSNMDDMEIVDRIEDIVAHSEHPEVDVKRLAERDFVLDNVVPAVQRAGTEDIVKYSLLDLEVYFRVRLSMQGQEASYKVSPALLERAGIEKQELIDRAMLNIRNHIHISSLARMLSERMGLPYDEDMENEVPMYVAYSDFNTFGASSILCSDKIQELADRLGASRLACLPASIHEWILLKFDDSMDLDMLTDMVQSVNVSDCTAEEVLSDHVYIWADGELLSY